MKKIIFLSFVFLLFLVSVISAAQPQIIDSGCEVRFPAVTIVKQNEDITSHLHVLNITTGAHTYLTNATTTCYAHLYNLTDHLLEQNYTGDENGLEFTLDIDGGNFSEIGYLTFYIQCESVGSICGASGSIEVTPTGRAAPTEGEGIIYLSTLLAMSLFSVFFFMLSLQFKPSQDSEKDEEGSYNPIPNDKPALRFGCLALSFIVLFMILLYAMVTIQTALSGFEKIMDSYYIFMWVMGFVFAIIFIFVLITLMIQAVDSLRSKRGLDGT